MTTQQLVQIIRCGKKLLIILYCDFHMENEKYHKIRRILNTKNIKHKKLCLGLILWANQKPKNLSITWNS